MTSIIQTSVLRAAVLSAFDRGRYQVQFGTAPAGDDIAVVPSSICLDLAERDDDLLGSTTDPWPGIFTPEEEAQLAEQMGALGRSICERFGIDAAFGADDHGPAVPAQDAPDSATSYMIQTGPSDQPGFSTMEEVVKVYEFALQGADCRFTTPKTLDEVQVGHAPDMNAFHAADWVHVYDRVTRERRTLKRPGADRIIKGLADVAADLRGKPTPPAPGPLTSAEGLLRGDVLRCIRGIDEMPDDQIVRVQRMHEWPGGHKEAIIDGLCWRHDRFAFVGRPGSDGWMDWPGGENPVGDAMVEVMHTEANWTSRGRASIWNKAWRHDTQGERDIVRFHLVDLPALPSDT